MNNKIFLSIIIPAYNNYEELNKLCNSIFKNETNNIEVIVIDDGSEISFQNIIDRYPIKYYKIKNSGPSFARNFGASKAIGENFLFLDSDTIIPENMLTKIYNFSKDHNHDVTSIFYSEEPSNNGLAQKFKSYFDYFNNVYNKDDGYIKSFQGSSCLFKKDMFILSKGWSENFKLASLENEEFATRLNKNNIKIYFTKDLYVSHTYPNFLKLLKVIFKRSVIWTQLKINKKVEFDKLVRTPYTAMITLMSFFIFLNILLINLHNLLNLSLALLTIIYLIGNIMFYKFVFSRVNIIQFFMIIFYLFIFQLVVSVGGIIGIILSKFYMFKK